MVVKTADSCNGEALHAMPKQDAAHDLHHHRNWRAIIEALQPPDKKRHGKEEDDYRR